MKINLKYGYVVDVDNHNPYTLMREEVKEGKATSRDRSYYYNLERLAEALRSEERRVGKECICATY